MVAGKYIRTNEIKKKISKKLIGRKLSKETKEKMKKNRKGMLGKNHNEETKRKISNKKKGTPKKGGYSFEKGKLNPNWNNGSSFEPYSVDWTKTLRRSIKERDKFRCKICFKDKKLAIHHINYNKKDCNPNNLITLCNSCHSKTNINRKKWINYFKNGEKKNVLD